MEILIVSTAFPEIQPLVGQMELVENLGDQYARFRFKDKELDILITGTGGGIGGYCLTRAIMKKRYQRVIHVGVCQSFREQPEVGTVVNVIDDQFGDLGIDGHEGFQTLFQLGVLRGDEYPFHKGVLENLEKFPPAMNVLRKVTGITLNRFPRRLEQINEIYFKFYPDVVSFDGAVVYYVCMQERIPCFQIRVVNASVHDHVSPFTIEPDYAKELCYHLEKVLYDFWEESDEKLDKGMEG